MANRHCALIFLLLTTPVLASHQTIPEGYRQIARQAGVPANVLYAVALTESGARLTHGIRPWPWTLNVAGKSWRYASRQKACTALLQFMQTHNPKRIDAGLGQINLGWNGRFFSAPCDALSPYRNLRVTARLLREHYEKQGNWQEAVGRYHHPAGGIHAQHYRQKVISQLQQLSS